MGTFTYRSKPIRIAGHADIARQYRPDGALATYVQQAIDGVEPWNRGDNPIETVKFETVRIYPMAIRTDRLTESPVWGVHVGHKAQRPGLSPFVEGHVRVDPQLLGYLTIEFDGTAPVPVLTRVYGGEYTPPLPWMGSAKSADGGVSSCFRYWRSHAYLDRHRKLIREGTRQETPPEWYLAV